MFRPLTGRSFDSTVKSALTIGLAAFGLTLAGCASLPAPGAQTCAAGEKPAEVAQLFFGRNIGKTAGVSEADWENFLDTEIMPRFPEGLSVIDAAGVWRGKDGSAVHELSKQVVLVLSGRPDEKERLMAVTAAYTKRFSQEAVMTLRSRACVAS